MSVRIHTTPVYDVEYGNTISSRLTDDIISIIKKSETGYVSDDEEELEISFEELKEIYKTTKNKELKEAIDLILKESDKNNDFIHLSIF